MCAQHVLDWVGRRTSRHRREQRCEAPNAARIMFTRQKLKTLSVSDCIQNVAYLTPRFSFKLNAYCNGSCVTVRNSRASSASATLVATQGDRDGRQAIVRSVKS